MLAPSLAAVSVVAAMASIIGRRWYASGDHALEVLRIGDVGGPHTPLLGAWSQWGWAHPGPALFWVLAPFDRLLGETGVLAGTGMINLGAVVGAVVVGRRRGGPPLALLVALLETILVHSMGLGAVVDPWNPTVAFLPFVLFLLLIWSVLCGDVVLLPIAVAVGSFSVQAHVGYLPIVGGLSASSALLLAATTMIHRVREERTGPSPRRLLLWSAAAAFVGLVVWLPPILQQLTGHPGNLGVFLDYALHPAEPAAGWRTAYGTFGLQFRIAGPWATGHDADALGLAASGSTIPAITFCAALGVAAVAGRRWGARDAARLAALALVAAGLGLVATARVTGIFVPYVLRWWWGVAGIGTLALVWAVVSALPARARAAVCASAVVAAIVITAVTMGRLPAPLPLPNLSRGIAAVSGPTAVKLDGSRRYLVRGVDSRGWGAAITGLYLELHRRGFRVFSDPGPNAELTMGSWRLARQEAVDEVLYIVDVSELDAGYQPPDGSRQLAWWDPLTPEQRTRARELEARIRAAMGGRAPAGRLLLGPPFARGLAVTQGALPADVEALHRLQQMGDGYVVFAAPAH